MIIAVTGNTGGGKSTVSDLFVRWGAKRIDADRIGREIWQGKKEVEEEILRELGPEVAGPAGEIDRRLLGDAVFGDPEKLRRFDRIVQPLLRRRILEELARAAEGEGEVWVLDAALLFEWGIEGKTDLVVVVGAKEEIRAARIAARHRLDMDDARERIRSQSPEAEKIRRGDRLIENNGTMEELERKARELWEEIVPEGRR